MWNIHSVIHQKTKHLANSLNIQNTLSHTTPHPASNLKNIIQNTHTQPVKKRSTCMPNTPLCHTCCTTPPHKTYHKIPKQHHKTHPQHTKHTHKTCEIWHTNRHDIEHTQQTHPKKTTTKLRTQNNHQTRKMQNMLTKTVQIQARIPAQI